MEIKRLRCVFKTDFHKQFQDIQPERNQSKEVGSMPTKQNARLTPNRPYK